MQDTLEQLGRFYKSFPMFDQYLDLFPRYAAIRFALQDLYVVYSDFSLHTVKYTNKRPTTHVFLNLFTSTPRRQLKFILRQWDEAKTHFEDCAQLEFRKLVISSTVPGAQSAPSVYSKTSIIKTTNVLRPHTYFIGRRELLINIYETLQKSPWTPGTEPTSCLIHGMGGMGKTQTALAYSKQYERDYDYCLWVRAETADRLTESYNTICQVLGIDACKPGYMDTVKDWLENTDRSWLLVFDNVEELTVPAFDALRPTRSTQRSAIILTSQLEQGKHLVQHSIPLKSLSNEDGVLLLLRCLRRDPNKIMEEEREGLKEVSSMLGGLPLAIAHIGGYISESKHNLAHFGDFFEKGWQNKAWSGKPLTEQCHKRLEIVWDLALEELPINSRKLLNVMAYLNPDAIPERWLTST